jgi:tRNA1(Val) A37 N6-methylase TrmN6
LKNQQNSLLKNGETIDDLEFENLKIIQSKFGYKFSTDSVLLANFGKAKQNDVYVDLCSGSSVIAILFLCKNKIKKGYAVEIQERLADMAKRSIELNNLSDRLSVLNDDIENVHKTLGYESVDVITINPPYNEVGETSDVDEIAIATHEIKTNLSKIAEVSSKLLKYGGKLFMVHRSDRLASIVYELKKNNLEPKVLRIVYPKKNKAPNLVLIEAKKGAKSGLKIMQPLILNNNDGTETEELKIIYARKGY